MISKSDNFFQIFLIPLIFVVTIDKSTQTRDNFKSLTSPF